MNAADQVVEFFAVGTPAPKGSKKAFVNPKTGRPIIVDDNRAPQRGWSRAVSEAAMEAMAGRAAFRDVELDIELVFGLERPRGHYGSGRNTSIVKSSSPFAPRTKPDWDKLTRSTADALKGVVYDDDSRIVCSRIAKIYVPVGMPTGAFIRVARAALDDIEEAREIYCANVPGAGELRVVEQQAAAQGGLFE